MKRLVLNIPDSEYRFFMKVIRNFSFVEIDKKKNKLLELEAKAELQKSLKQVKKTQEGKIEKQKAQDFLNEQ